MAQHGCLPCGCCGRSTPAGLLGHLAVVHAEAAARRLSSSAPGRSASRCRSSRSPRTGVLRPCRRLLAQLIGRHRGHGAAAARPWPAPGRRLPPGRPLTAGGPGGCGCHGGSRSRRRQARQTGLARELAWCAATAAWERRRRRASGFRRARLPMARSRGTHRAATNRGGRGRGDRERSAAPGQVQPAATPATTIRGPSGGGGSRVGEFGAAPALSPVRPKSPPSAPLSSRAELSSPKEHDSHPADVLHAQIPWPDSRDSPSVWGRGAGVYLACLRSTLVVVSGKVGASVSTLPGALACTGDLQSCRPSLS